MPLSAKLYHKYNKTEVFGACTGCLGKKITTFQEN